MLTCQPSRPEVPMHVLHGTLDDAAPECRGVDHVAAARVDGHVGYGMIWSRFLEKDQISRAEVRLFYALSHIPLPYRVIRQLHPLAEDQARKAGAVLRLVSLAREWRRVPVGGTEVRPRPFEYLRFHGGTTGD